MPTYASRIATEAENEIQCVINTYAYFFWSVLMAHHKTLSPPPPALQYGWKKATSSGRFPSLPADLSCFFLCSQSRTPHSSTTKQMHKIPLRNNAGSNNEHSNLKQARNFKICNGFKELPGMALSRRLKSRATGSLTASWVLLISEIISVYDWQLQKWNHYSACLSFPQLLICSHLLLFIHALYVSSISTWSTHFVKIVCP